MKENMKYENNGSCNNQSPTNRIEQNRIEQNRIEYMYFPSTTVQFYTIDCTYVYFDQ